MSEQLSKTDESQIGEIGKINPGDAEVPQPIDLESDEDQGLTSLLEQARQAELDGDLEIANTLLRDYHERYSKLKIEQEIEKEKTSFLDKNQKVYDFLFGGEDRTNLLQQFENGQIGMLSAEEEEAAKKLGFTEKIIIPNPLKRNEVIDLIKDKSKISSHIDDNEYKENTAAEKAKDSSYDKNFYVIMMKKSRDLEDGFEETAGKTPEQAKKIIDEISHDKKINFRGLNLPEYFLTNLFFSINEKNYGIRGIDEKVYLLDEYNAENDKTLLVNISVFGNFVIGSNNDGSSNWLSPFVAVPELEKKEV